jgi:hypothetical protein
MLESLKQIQTGVYDSCQREKIPPGNLSDVTRLPFLSLANSIPAEP